MDERFHFISRIKNDEKPDVGLIILQIFQNMKWDLPGTKNDFSVDIFC